MTFTVESLSDSSSEENTKPLHKNEKVKNPPQATNRKKKIQQKKKNQNKNQKKNNNKNQNKNHNKNQNKNGRNAKNRGKLRNKQKSKVQSSNDQKTTNNSPSESSSDTSSESSSDSEFSGITFKSKSKSKGEPKPNVEIIQAPILENPLFKNRKRNQNSTNEDDLGQTKKKTKRNYYQIRNSKQLRKEFEKINNKVYEINRDNLSSKSQNLKRENDILKLGGTVTKYTTPYPIMLKRIQKQKKQDERHNQIRAQFGDVIEKRETFNQKQIKKRKQKKYQRFINFKKNEPKSKKRLGIRTNSFGVVKVNPKQF
ncbi:dentin sialophosphoprotein-like protein [Anaeramoeba flamelloides]|uniref:Dentin sialophosphoprotein-like protein n=1 Tax=Anaeramoeba flamelloides TaxID=1746091 RepID=A0AAV7YNA1_9EUKA|nr:dentin sialophosphoprotein-like protein [Anaeramoeba flamelloides]